MGIRMSTELYRWIDDLALPGGGYELMLTVTGTIGRGNPGRYSGPPEDCYPAEAGEVEIEEVRVTRISAVADPVLVGTAGPEFLTDDEHDSAVERLAEAAAEAYDDCDE